ncbi:MAG: long-chain fatty acid--CoA ligase, partial [Akkermansiaceae bacterium]|nr:long-chain fatty acid--CoA ligase [Akkermansiaceae bacterium]
MSDDPGRIRRGVEEFIRSPDGRFSALAVALFAHQFEANRPYRAYCEALGATPDGVGAWDEVPAVPADTFKAGLPLSCFPSGDAARVFLTSGTTAEVRGRHYFAQLDTHALSIRRGWEDAGLPRLASRLFLSRPPGAHPESSLAFMFETLGAPPATSRWLLDPDGRPRPGLLESAAAGGEPVLLFGTSLALLHLLEALPAPVPLPAGSWIFHTGGYKGQRRRTDPAELAALAEDGLRVPPGRTINEYGMTELSSQCYAAGPDAPHRAPAWMKVRVLNP